MTGGSRGLGRAAALILARAGADVVIGYVKDRKSAIAVVAQCRELGVRAIPVRADMAQSSEIGAMFRETMKHMNRLDILVCCAGIWREAAIDRMTDQQLDEMISVDLRSVILCCREAASVMKRRRTGRIILVSSTAGQRGEALHSHYAAAKGGVISLAKSLAVELAPSGILVNCIAPGWFDTDMSRPTLEDGKLGREVLESIPLGRVGRPEEFAGAVLFLASDLSTFVTGEVLNVNGGAVLAG
ncbi:MAG: SDR family oxidoreductase [candidate division WOR-3 bacterium]